MYTKPVDLLGRDIKVGDKIAYGDTTSTQNAVICYGEVVAIYPGPIRTKLVVNEIKHGADSYKYKRTRYFVYPRNYHNIIIINT